MLGWSQVLRILQTICLCFRDLLCADRMLRAWGGSSLTQPLPQEPAETQVTLQTHKL